MKNFGRFFRFSNKTLKFGGVTLLAGTAVIAQSDLKFPLVSGVENKHVQPSKIVLPEVKISRKVTSSIDTSGLNLRLYQYQTCPFCCKVRAFLDYYGFAYEVVEVNSVTRKEIKFSEYKKVPIMIVQGWHGKQLNDSSFIISLLRTYTLDPSQSLDEIKSFYPIFKIKDEEDEKKVTLENDNKYFVMFHDKLKSKDDIGNRREEREWRRWVDDTFVHTISPNIYRTFGESLESFKWFSQNGNWQDVFPLWERLFVVYVGALAMYFVAKKLKQKHYLKPDVRESLYDVCNEWVRAIGKHRQFMGGEHPNLADLAVYGVLTSFEGCSAFKDMLENTKIGPWFYATKSAVQSRDGSAELERNLALLKKAQ